jgi:nitrogen-specific signal transduction histidine kinase
MGTTNEELEGRSKELDALSQRYFDTLEKMPWPLMLVVDDGRIQLWNTAAEKLFGLASKAVIGLNTKQLPVSESLRKVLIRSCRDSLLSGKTKIVRGCYIELDSFTGQLDIHFTPLKQEGTPPGLIVGFQASGSLPFAGQRPARRRRTSPRRVRLRAKRRKK